MFKKVFKIETEFEFEAAHKLSLNYASLCSQTHGHSYKCAVTITSHKLDINGMICDFKVLKKIIKERIEDKLDHKYLNDVFDCNATAEFMSSWILDEVNKGLIEEGIGASCVCVKLNETSKNKAICEVASV